LNEKLRGYAPRARDNLGLSVNSGGDEPTAASGNISGRSAENPHFRRIGMMTGLRGHSAKIVEKA